LPDLPYNKRKNDFRLAVEDIVLGSRKYSIWAMLAWSDIRQRYSRSVLGPFWLTLSSGVLIFTLGPLYGRLFRIPLEQYFTHIAVSLVCWGLVASLVMEACTPFTAAEGYIKQIKIPFTIFVLRTIFRNVIIFAHTLVVVVVVFFFFPTTIGFGTLGIVLGILLLSVNAFWLSIVLGILSVRFRDVPQIINSIVGVAFFLTPVIWQTSMLGRKAWLVQLNPFYHFIEVIRSPLLHNQLNYGSILFTGFSAILGCIFTILFFSRYRSRIAYWL